MKSLNKVQLIGRVGGDPETRSIPSGKKVANFTVATSWGAGDKEKTEWHRIVAWEKLADITESYVKKGDPIYIEGEINYRSYEDKDGVTKHMTEVRAFNLILLGGKPGATPAKATAGVPESVKKALDLEDDEEEWPF
jgi:single-strand DNA-binding protein